MNRSMELYEKLTVVQWLLQRQRHRVRAGGRPCGGPSCGQGRILAMLKLKDDISTKDLSHVLASASRRSTRCWRSWRRAATWSATSEEDKRVMLVTLTQKGARRRPGGAAPTGVFSCLTDEEQEQMAAYLDRLIAALEESMGEDGRESPRAGAPAIATRCSPSCAVTPTAPRGAAARRTSRSGSAARSARADATAAGVEGAATRAARHDGRRRCGARPPDGAGVRGHVPPAAGGAPDQLVVSLRAPRGHRPDQRSAVRPVARVLGHGPLLRRRGVPAGHGGVPSGTSARASCSASSRTAPRWRRCRASR